MHMWWLAFILSANAQEITKVETRVQITGGLVTLLSTVQVNSLTEPFIHCISPKEAHKVSSVMLLDGTHLSPSHEPDCFDVPLNSPTFTIVTTLVNMLTPSPAHITQLTHQTVLLKLNGVLYSPYSVGQQSTSMRGTFLDYDNAVYDSSTLTLGPLINTPPFSEEVMTVFMFYEDPLLTLTHYKRRIEISHWGFVHVREMVELTSRSAKVESFSRLDYSGGAQKAPSVHSLEVRVPGGSSGIYFRDDVGNISTSAVKGDLLTLGLRYPLVSGWTTQLEYGYQLPAQHCLRLTDGQYVLRQPFMTSHFNHQTVDEFELQIVFPSHAYDVILDTLPFPLESISVGEYSAYLDVQAPRPTLVVKARNLNPAHSVDIKVTYRHNTAMLLLKPLALSLMCLLLFMCVMCASRLDLSILTPHVFNVHFSANQLSKVYEDVLYVCQQCQGRIDIYKKERDEEGFEDLRQTFDRQVKTAKKEAVRIEEEISAATVEDKMKGIVEDVVASSRQMRELLGRLSSRIQQTFACAKKLVSGGMSAEDYTLFEIKNIAERSDILTTMDTLIHDL